MQPKRLGIIFDMDGVIIDSNPYHKIAWTTFLKKRGLVIDDHLFKKLIFGTTGDEAISHLLNKQFSKKELDILSDEIDAEYRKIITESNSIKPIDGLINFLDSISHEGCKVALATSAPTENVDLILDLFKIRDYFDVILDKNGISKGKPDPEIYIKVVKYLGIDKSNCIVFEDSFAGIQSAVDAGLKVIGLTTSHSDQELISAGATSTINDFSKVSCNKMLYL